MSGFAPLEPLEQMREQAKRNKQAMVAEEMVKEIAGDNSGGNLLAKLARSIFKQNLEN